MDLIVLRKTDATQRLLGASLDGHTRREGVIGKLFFGVVLKFGSLLGGIDTGPTNCSVICSVYEVATVSTAFVSLTSKRCGVRSGCSEAQALINATNHDV